MLFVCEHVCPLLTHQSFAGIGVLFYSVYLCHSSVNVEVRQRSAVHLRQSVASRARPHSTKILSTYFCRRWSFSLCGTKHVARWKQISLHRPHFPVTCSGNTTPRRKNHRPPKYSTGLKKTRTEEQAGSPNVPASTHSNSHLQWCKHIRQKLPFLPFWMISHAGETGAPPEAR